MRWLSKLFKKSKIKQKPTCLGDYPFTHDNIFAERDCGVCPFQFECFEDSNYYSQWRKIKKI